MPAGCERAVYEREKFRPPLSPAAAEYWTQNFLSIKLAILGSTQSTVYSVLYFLLYESFLNKGYMYSQLCPWSITRADTRHIKMFQLIWIQIGAWIRPYHSLLSETTFPFPHACIGCNSSVLLIFYTAALKYIVQFRPKVRHQSPLNVRSHSCLPSWTLSPKCRRRLPTSWRDHFVRIVLAFVWAN